MANSEPIAVKDNSSKAENLWLENRLGQSRSPYLRKHMNNPVAWQEWSQDALDLAKRHNLLIFLSIGFAASHWCHVMQCESFENSHIARLLNENFIPIKVDSEVRPDLDRIYMNYHQAQNGSAGWPLNVFLTPTLLPLFAGTYWPGPDSATAHQDHITFAAILETMKDVWKNQQEKCIDGAQVTIEQLKEFAQEGLASKVGLGNDSVDKTAEELDIDLVEEAVQHFRNNFDTVHGGFGIEPKFPTPVKLRFLLALNQYSDIVRQVVGDSDVEYAKSMALFTLDKIWNSGLRDHIGHGISRYSETKDWGLPSFEKMLYDQALLLQTYIDAFLVTRYPRYLDAIIDIATYITSPPILAENGGFYSSEAADSLAKAGDSDQHVGAFYLWTYDELVDTLGKSDADIVSRYWGIHQDGNVSRAVDSRHEFLHMNVLSISTLPEIIAKEFSLSEAEILQIVQNATAKLRARRDAHRPRPELDDKILLGWNGLAIGALARASSALSTLDDDDNDKTYQKQANSFLDAAKRAVAFIKSEMRNHDTGHLIRVWREGPGEVEGFADDYSFLISGLLHLYEATWDDSYLEFADDLQTIELNLFWDSDQGGFFCTADRADLILRLKDGHDNAEPSINGYSARNLFRLASFFQDQTYKDKAKRTLHAFEAEIMQYPHLFCGMLDSVISERLGVKSTVITGSGSAVDEQVKRLRKHTGVSRTLVRIAQGSNDLNVKEGFLRKKTPCLQNLDSTKFSLTDNLI